MTAGLNLVVRIWDFIYSYGDDDVGGALPSGTILHERVDARIHSNRPTQALLEQGIEDISTFTGLLHPATLLVSNNNEVEVIAPANSPYYGEFFRVVGNPQRTSHHPSDSRGYFLVSLEACGKITTSSKIIYGTKF